MSALSPGIIIVHNISGITMKRITCTAFLCLLSAVLGLSAQTFYYVSPNGNDGNEGTLQSPFQSIVKAQLEARKTQGETIIFLREGKYRLSEPLVFTADDGNEHKSLVLRAFSDERVVICGNIVLHPEWKPFRKGIVQADVPSDFDVDLLTVNDVIRPLARYPNYDSTAIRFNGVSADATSPKRVKRWKNPAGGYLHAMHAADWGDFHYRITGKDAQGNLKLEGGWQNNRPYGLSEQNRMVENIFEELDAPGEWYYDRSASVLYYYPLPGENPGDCTFEAARLKHLVELRGDMEHPVKNIRMEGIAFTGTARTFMEKYEPLLRSDWTVYRGGAVVFEGAEDCTLHNCTLYNLGGNAIFFSNYNRRCTVSGSHITQVGASAVCFVGSADAVRSPSFTYEQFVPLSEMDCTPGPLNENYPAHCLVYDNLIHRIGLFEKQITGVELSMCQYITVSHNSIYDTPRAGINVSEGTWGGHIIEHNDVFETVKETGDHGSFNSWGRDRFWHPNRQTMDSIVEARPELILADARATTVIRHNRFRCDRGWDIDLDDGSSNYHIYDNLCLNGGIKLREGFYRVVENNILVNNTFHPHVWFRNSGDVFVRNIVMAPYLPINLQAWGAEVDYNIFTDSIAYAPVMTLPTDKHSIVYPVHFSDPMQGNYQVADGSSAIFRLGFRNFRMDDFGVVSPRLKQLAHRPQFSFPIINKEVEAEDMVTWKGVRMKSLTTLGERSATGMDSERGVYVISVVDPYSPLKDYLKANDVILRLGKTPINDMDDFWMALKQIRLDGMQEMVIHRNQKETVLRIPGQALK